MFKRDPPVLIAPATFAYRYRWRLLGWLLEEHSYLRELLFRFWPRAIQRVFTVTERVAEIPFVIRSLSLPRGSLILDVGSRWSLLPLFLTALGYRTVALDLAEIPAQVRGPWIVRADIRRPPFRAGMFDGVTVVSTLEHIGIGAYDTRRNLNDDLVVMRAIRELMKPGGTLVLTVPFGRPAVGRRQRVYDLQRIEVLSQRWIRDAITFYVRHGQLWEESDEREASTVDSAEETRAVALLRLRRS